MKQIEHLYHEFGPVYSKDSEILILGSFPSAKSRETRFYYGHKQNRFWKMLAAIYDCAVPGDIEEKKALIIEHKLALWDTVAECDIVGSSDSTIANVMVNDFSLIYSGSRIIKTLANGKTAAGLYEKYAPEAAAHPITVMPSTSPANAAWSMEMLTAFWQQELLRQK